MIVILYNIKISLTMEKYFLFALRSDSHSDFETIYEKVFSSYCLSLDSFLTLVGQCVSSISKCVVTSYQTDDSPYLKKVRVSSGDVLIYIYLQKLS